MLTMHFMKILVLGLYCVQLRIMSVTCSCVKFGTNCLYCNATHCTECSVGFYGSDCASPCTGHCQYDCDMQTGLCRTCTDGYYGTNCSLHCSDKCSETSCNRSTGACTGCIAGHCSPDTGCTEKCFGNCSDCNFETCKCKTCNPGDDCYGTSSTLPPTGTTPHSPTHGQGHIMNDCSAAYWIGSTVNTVYLVLLFIFYRLEQILWKQIQQLWCKKTRGEQGKRNDPARQPLADDSIEKRFQEIPNDEDDGAASVALANKAKNNHRYSYPYDRNRVGLLNDEYINASFVNGTNLGVSRSYITTQQPMKNTKDSFWRMIWEQHVGTIVVLSTNLTNQVDRNLRGVNCQVDFGQIHVQTNGTLTKKTSYTVRKLKIQKETENGIERDVNLYLFHNWYRKSSLCDFLKEIRNVSGFKSNESPVTIFSSEGEGPAAIFVALDFLMERMNIRDHPPLDMYECVNDLASQRRCMFPDTTTLKRLLECYMFLQKEKDVSTSTSRSTGRKSLIRFLVTGVILYILMNWGIAINL